MKLRKNNKLVTIALILLMTFSAIAMATLQTVYAHTPPLTVNTYAFLNVAPDPVGVGQTAWVNMWLNLVPPTANSAYGDRWHNFTLKVTKPDGTTQTLGPFTSDAVGGHPTSYVPDQVGTYSFVFEFPGQTLTGENPGPFGTSSPEYVGDYFEPSTSTTVTLTVQQTQIQPYPSTPLPSNYWARPIESVNGEWYQISGNWLGLSFQFASTRGMCTYNATGNFNPYTLAPNSAHILWTKPVAAGGLVGGEFGGTESSNYYTGMQYEPKFAPIIINGVLYYNLYPGSWSNPAGWVAADLRTGQTIFTTNNTAVLRAGQTYQYVSPNQYGSIPYLWSSTGTTASMYDAFTGNWILDIVDGAPMISNNMILVEGDDGSLLGYYVNNTDSTLNMWNSSKAILQDEIDQAGPGYQAAEWQWRPRQGAQIPWSYGIEWSMPIATSISGESFSPGLGFSAIGSDVIVMTSAPNAVATRWQRGWQIEAGYSTKTGEQLWLVNRTETPDTWVMMGTAGYGVYVEFTKETLTWSGYSLYTGEKLWGPTEPEPNSWAYYNGGGRSPAVVAYGNLYTWSLSGYVYCYDLQNGNVKWTWNTGASGYETPYGVWPLWVIANYEGAVADGKIYVEGGHNYSPPLYKGAQLYCLNATTGDLIWSVLNFDSSSTLAIADGEMLALNSYDNQIYAYGTGLSATTVTASPKVVQSGSVLFEGTVTDESPGQTCLGIPAAGTPAISDASMTEWMEYLYMQQPKPNNATGVPVHLTAIDPNGNYQDIGTTTTDADGTYAMSWTPPIPGVYKVTATFAGTNSYYSSTGTTHFLAENAASAQPTSPPTALPSQAPQPATNEVPTTTYLAIAAAVVIIVAVAAALILRKRK